MASLIISYFASVDKEVAGVPLKSEILQTSSASVASEPVPPGAAVALIQSEAPHFVAFGDGDPVASAETGFYLASNTRFWLRTFTAQGQVKKIAAVAVS